MKLLKFNNVVIFKILIILFLLIIPWSLSDYTDNITPEKITSDLRFYQINTCSISLFEFLTHNFNVIYQDHYKIKFNDYSSMKCFGQITGVDQVGYDFYISIGTNAFVNLFLQSTFWLLLISFIRREKEYSINLLQLFSISLGSLLFCLGIFAEQRFYGLKLYLLDLTTYKAYIYIFIYFFYVSFFSRVVIGTRNNKIIYLIPFLYIFIGLYSGWNIYFFTVFFVIYGIEKILDSTVNKKYFSLLNLVTIFWGYQAIGKDYFLDPDKVRGLSSSGYNFLSVIFWSYYTVCLFIGIYYFFKERSRYFNLENFGDKFIYSGSIIFLLGYLGSSIPFINFFNYYIFGQTKYGTDNQKIFGLNYWGERVAWRGYFPSAETIGEFFAIGLLIYFLLRVDGTSSNRYVNILLPFSFAGLYASNNKAATIALLFCIILKINKKYKLSRFRKALIFSSILIPLIIFIRPENLLYSFNFSSKNMINLGIGYSLDSNRSSAINHIQGMNSNSITYWIMLILGQFAFLINRSELWGIFFARYNPNILEFLFGTGSFTLSDHYSDIDILPYRISTGTDLGFLLPHSSLFLSFLFFGIVGTLIIIYLISKKIRELRNVNYNNYLISLFIVINIVKSDSVLYFPSLLMYFVFLVVFSRKKLYTED